MEKVIKVNKHKLSSGIKPVTRKEHRDICFGFLGGSQAFHFREPSSKQGGNTTEPGKFRRKKTRIQKRFRTQNRKA